MSLFPHIIKEKKNIIKNIIKENIIKKLQKFIAHPETLRQAINRLHYLQKNLFARVIYRPRAKYSLKGLKHASSQQDITLGDIRRHDIRRSGLPPIKQFVLSKYKPHSEITTKFLFLFH